MIHTNNDDSTQTALPQLPAGVANSLRDFRRLPWSLALSSESASVSVFE